MPETIANKPWSVISDEKLKLFRQLAELCIELEHDCSHRKITSIVEIAEDLLKKNG